MTASHDIGRLDGPIISKHQQRKKQVRDALCTRRPLSQQRGCLRIEDAEIGLGAFFEPPDRRGEPKRLSGTRGGQPVRLHGVKAGAVSLSCCVGVIHDTQH